MSVRFNQHLKDTHLQELMMLKNMMNAGFVNMNYEEYSNMDYLDSWFLLEHERQLREKHKEEMEEKSREIQSKNKRGRTIASYRR